jgi:hypothetical protein
VLQSIRHLLDRPKCFRLGRASPGGTCTHGFNVPLQGTHNNISENALRRVAVGRGNWLFCGSDNGGSTAAILFSFIATCERHQLNPWAYLRDVLSRIAAIPTSRLAELLPEQWQPAAAPSSQTT